MKSALLPPRDEDTRTKRLAKYVYNWTVWLAQASQEAWIDNTHPEYEIVTGVVVPAYGALVFGLVFFFLNDRPWWLGIPAETFIYLFFGAFYYLVRRRTKQKDPEI